MNKTQQVSKTLGTLDEIQNQIAQMTHQLQIFSMQLSVVRKALSSPESPFGVVYPQHDNE